MDALYLIVTNALQLLLLARLVKQDTHIIQVQILAQVYAQLVNTTTALTQLVMDAL